MNRRAFLGLSVALGAAGAGAAASGGSTFDLQTLERHVTIPDLSPEFDGYRIGFVSDVHSSVALPDGYVRDAFSRVLSRGVDVVLLGGDYLWIPESRLVESLCRDGDPRYAGRDPVVAAARIFDDLVPLMRDLRAPDGVFGVYGNHDRWHHPTLCRDALGRAGVRLLCNESVEIRRGNAALRIDGIDDYLTGRPSLPTGNEAAAAKILLAHNPDYASLLIREGRFDYDLALCGHTHGGQIRIPVVGVAPLVGVTDRSFVSGLHDVSPRGSVYTSRGVGVVELPLRVACPPDVTILELARS